MVKTQKRASSAVISKAAIANAASTLEALPAKPKSNWSLRETIALLQDSIIEALNKGYSYPEVSKMLSLKGVDISASSLKSYLSAAKRGKNSTAKKTTRKAKVSDSNVVALNPKAAKAPRAAKKSETTASEKSGRQPKLTVVGSEPKSSQTVAKSASSASSRVPKAAPKATPRGRKKLG
jgi:hypothetical protein